MRSYYYSGRARKQFGQKLPILSHNGRKLPCREGEKHQCRICKLLQGHDKLWVNGKVRRAILQIDCALMGHGTSHIGVTEIVSNVMDEYVTHGLHLNS